MIHLPCEEKGGKDEFFLLFTERNFNPMKRYLLTGISTGLATVVGATALLIGSSQPSSAAFPGRVFGCSNPGPGLQTYSGSPNALIASPVNATPGFPVQANIAIFGDVFQANGLVTTGETRCFQAMRILNALNTQNLVGNVAITYQPMTNGRGVTGALVCMVPAEAAGMRNCGQPIAIANPNVAPPMGNSYVLFAISQSPTPIQTAANIAETLGSLVFVPGSAVSGAQVDGRSRI